MENYKKINGWLIVDYRSGKLRTAKKLINNKLKPSEIAIELKLDLIIPEIPKIIAEGKIILSKAHVAQMMIEQFDDAGER